MIVEIAAELTEIAVDIPRPHAVSAGFVLLLVSVPFPSNLNIDIAAVLVEIAAEFALMTA